MNPRPRKGLGQNFLIYQGVVNRIIAAAALLPGEPVLEIGPGRGALTLPLARLGNPVLAVEKDPYLVDFLGAKLAAAGLDNVQLIHADILKWDFEALERVEGSRFMVLGNLPYNISSPLIEKLVENRRVVSRAVLMLQLEMARRLTASPGNKDYGAMTLLIRYTAKTLPLFQVSSAAFRPRPKVDSMVVSFDFGAPYPRAAQDERLFRMTVKGAFGHRRKTLLNSLVSMREPWPREVLLGALGSCGIDPGRRAETLDMEEFLCLSDALVLTKPPEDPI